MIYLVSTHMYVMVHRLSYGPSGVPQPVCHGPQTVLWPILCPNTSMSWSTDCPMAHRLSQHQYVMAHRLSYGPSIVPSPVCHGPLTVLGSIWCQHTCMSWSTDCRTAHLMSTHRYVMVHRLSYGPSGVPTPVCHGPQTVIWPILFHSTSVLFLQIIRLHGL